MLKFILERFLSGILILFGVIVIVFFLLNVIPVDAGRLTLGQNADSATIEATNKKFRLNYSAVERFWFYLADLSPISVHEKIDPEKPLYLDSENYSFVELFTIGSKALVLKKPYLGRSFQSDKPVLSILLKKIIPTGILAISAISIATILGIFLGIFAALKKGTIIDKMIVTFSITGISVPSYFSAIVLSVLFGFYLSNYTGLNVTGPLIDISDYGNYFMNWKNLILPTIALGIRPIAIIVQLTRNSMLDVLGADFVRTAKSKGLSNKKVIFKHVLRNALNPVVTSITGWFAALLAGAFFVEWVFDFKGLGSETVHALLNFDFPLVMGSILLVAFVFILVNILVDILYSFLDPRIKLNA